MFVDGSKLFNLESLQIGNQEPPNDVIDILPLKLAYVCKNLPENVEVISNNITIKMSNLGFFSFLNLIKAIDKIFCDQIG